MYMYIISRVVFKGSLAVASEFEYILLIGQLEFISLSKCCIIDTLSKTHNRYILSCCSSLVCCHYCVRCTPFIYQPSGLSLSHRCSLQAFAVGDHLVRLRMECLTFNLKHIGAPSLSGVPHLQSQTHRRSACCVHCTRLVHQPSVSCPWGYAVPFMLMSYRLTLYPVAVLSLYFAVVFAVHCWFTSRSSSSRYCHKGCVQRGAQGAGVPP